MLKSFKDSKVIPYQISYCLTSGEVVFRRRSEPYFLKLTGSSKNPGLFRSNGEFKGIGLAVLLIGEGIAKLLDSKLWDIPIGLVLLLKEEESIFKCSA